MYKRTVNNIKDIRLLIDGLDSLVESNLNLEPHLVNDLGVKLKLAKAWLGECLAVTGNVSPYKKDGKRNKKEDIEKAADSLVVIDAMIKAYPDHEFSLANAFILKNDETVIHQDNEGAMTYFTDLNTVQKVDWLKEQIKKITKTFLALPPAENLLQRECLDNTFKNLTEARFVAGFILTRLR